MDYQAIIQRYKDKGDIRKATFVDCFYLQKMERQKIMDLMFMNNRQVFHRLKKSIQKDIITRYEKEKLDRQWLFWYYYSGKNKNLKKAYFIKMFFIEWTNSHSVMDKLYLTKSEFYRLKDSLTLEARKYNDK